MKVVETVKFFNALVPMRDKMDLQASRKYFRASLIDASIPMRVSDLPLPFF